MRKEWNEKSALKALNAETKVSDKIIYATNGLKGLTECGAIDFLVNHCGYKYINITN